MELIDRRKLVSDFWQGVEDGAILSFEDTDDLMENAPTVDAVEVVRCKACKFWERHTQREVDYGYCDIYRCVKSEDGFCNRAYRRKDNGC